MDKNSNNEAQTSHPPTTESAPRSGDASRTLNAAQPESEYLWWAKQLVEVWGLKAKGMKADELASKLCECFDTVRRRTAESIGDIQVKQECVGPNEFAFKVYLGGKDMRYQADTQDMGILLALGEKYLERGNQATDFAAFAARILRIDSAWAK